MTSNITPAPEGYMSVKDAAEYCGIAWRTMYQHLQRGNIPAEGVRVENRCTFIHHQTVEDFKAYRAVNPKSRVGKMALPADEMLAEYEHLASIIGTEMANRRLIKLYGLNEDTIQKMQANRKTRQRRREARNAA